MGSLYHQNQWQERPIEPFCAESGERRFYDGTYVYGIWDLHPASPGHALLIPKRHVASWFDKFGMSHPPKEIVL